MPERAYPRFLPVGDIALTVEFGDEITLALNDAVVRLDIALAAAELKGIIETVPGYRSLLICYDPMEMSFPALVLAVRGLLSAGPRIQSHAVSDWTIPVNYDPPFGEDVAEAAHHLGLTEAGLIALHTEAEYQVYMVGFAPGLPYLGGLPAALHIPRRDVPRAPVTEGSVMIGGMQCGIASIATPTAWYKLGHTPLRPFEPVRPDPFLFRAGDRVRFRRIDTHEFQRLAALSTDDLLPLVQR